jgi:moderate conductance mechanosensitive channel
MQAPAQPEAALHEIISVEAMAALAIAALVASAIALLVGSLTKRLLLAIEGDRFHSQPIAQATVKAVRRVTFVLSLLVLAFPALDLAGVTIAVGLHPEDVTRWLTESGARILLLILLAFAANRFAASVIRNAEHQIVDGDDFKTLERRKRLHTVGATLRRFFGILIWAAAGLMVLRELDVDITPVLAGASIIGLAVGFGAQTLVKDIISGLFLIAEDQVRIGDVAEINGIGGAVEEINLRTIVLRDAEGAVQVFPNGTIGTLANMSKIYAYAVVDVRVAYSEHLDRVMATFNEIGESMANDSEWKPLLLAPIDVLGVESISDGFSVIRVRLKTPPLTQNKVANELRRRIVTTFVARGIRPYAG